MSQVWPKPTEVMALRVKESRQVDRGNYILGKNARLISCPFCVKSGETCFPRTLLDFEFTLKVCSIVSSPIIFIVGPISSKTISPVTPSLITVGTKRTLVSNYRY